MRTPSHRLKTSDLCYYAASAKPVVGTLYVAIADGGYVKGYRTDTYENIWTLGGLANKYPMDISYDTKTKNLWISLNDGNQILVYNIETSVTHTANVTHPNDVVLSPDGNKAYCVYGTTGIAEIDTSTFAVTYHIVGTFLWGGITINDDGSLLYVGSQLGMSSWLYVVKTSDWTYTYYEYTDIGSVRYLQYVNGTIYASTGYGLEIVAIDAAHPEYANCRHIPAGNGTWFVKICGNRGYVANMGDDTVTAFDTSDGHTIATIPVGHTPEGLAVLSDGSKIFTSNYDEGSLSIIDGKTNTLITTIAGIGNGPYGMCIAEGTIEAPPNPHFNHIITGSSDGALIDYPITLRIHAGAGTNSGIDCYLNGGAQSWTSGLLKDIRFIKDGTEMPFFVLSCDASTCLVAVKMDSLAQSTACTLRVEYGWTTDMSTSSGTATFPLFFDHFDGSAIDYTNNWTQKGIFGSPSVAVSNSQLVVSDNSAYIEIGSKTTFAGTGGYGFFVRHHGDTDALMGTISFRTGTWYTGVACYDFANGLLGISNQGISHQLTAKFANTQASQYHVYRCDWPSTSLARYEQDEDGNSLSTTQYVQNQQCSVDISTPMNGTITIDYIAVFPTTTNKPTHGAWS